MPDATLLAIKEQLNHATCPAEVDRILLPHRGAWEGDPRWSEIFHLAGMTRDILQTPEREGRIAVFSDNYLAGRAVAWAWVHRAREAAESPLDLEWRLALEIVRQRWDRTRMDLPQVGQDSTPVIRLHSLTRAVRKSIICFPPARVLDAESHALS